jgi:hypothetical protein
MPFMSAHIRSMHSPQVRAQPRRKFSKKIAWHIRMCPVMCILGMTYVKSDSGVGVSLRSFGSVSKRSHRWTENWQLMLYDKRTGTQRRFMVRRDLKSASCILHWLPEPSVIRDRRHESERLTVRLFAD